MLPSSPLETANVVITEPIQPFAKIVNTTIMK